VGIEIEGAAGGIAYPAAVDWEGIVGDGEEMREAKAYVRKMRDSGRG
jgi:hypothetical protein